MNAALQQRHSPQPSSGVAAGRVASNHIVNALHWEPGSRLDVILIPHTVVIRAVPLPEVATALAALTGELPLAPGGPSADADISSDQ
jgi:hypothetical protein